MPVATLDAFRDHGRVRGDTIMEALGEAQEALVALARLGIDLDSVAEQLRVDGIQAFAKDYDRVLAAIPRNSAPLQQSVSRRDGTDTRFKRVCAGSRFEQ